MKRFTALILLVVLLFCALSLAGCGANQTDNVLEAWTGDFSEDNFKKAISEYQDGNYTPFTAKGDNELLEVTFKTDYIISSCRVVVPSVVKNNDIDLELKGGIYKIVESEFTFNEVTVSTDWWYDSDDWTKDYTLWSYLVCVEDTDGIKHYYYFRTDYSNAG